MAPPDFPQPDYGFIGLGQMGYPMCCNLRKKIPATSKLYICDVVPEALERFMDEMKGVGETIVAANPKEVVQKADIVITMLPKSPHVQHVFYKGADNLISGLDATAQSVPERWPKKLLVDCSTIDAAVTREVGAEVEKTGLAHFADAAVSGGPLGARDGTLTFMIGCDPRLVDGMKNITGMMGSNLFHCGPIGAGVSVKLINNYISGCQIIAASEGLNMGVKMGLDPKVLTDILNASSGQSWSTSKNNPVPGITPGGAASREYKGGFAIELALSVIELGVQAAQGVGAKLVLAPCLLKAFREAVQHPRCKGLDARVIYRWLSEADVERAAEGP